MYVHIDEYIVSKDRYFENLIVDVSRFYSAASTHRKVFTHLIFFIGSIPYSSSQPQFFFLMAPTQQTNISK